MNRLQSNMKGLMLGSALRTTFLHTSTALSLALLTTVAVMPQAEAQVTTSGMRGVVTSDGAPVAGAMVTIVHEPSGSRKVTTTNNDGSYSVKNLRVGGPYSVTVTSDSGNGKVGEIFLTLDETSSVPISVISGDTLEEVIVYGAALTGGTKFGMSTNIGEDKREGVPATSRELYDVIRIDPLVTIDPTNSNAISIAGANNRFNSVTVDGVKQNDDFGLNNGGFPTQRSPISLDVIEQISVNAAPFSVEYGGFQGGNINVVTKSGTNDFHGSAFFYYRNGGLTGSNIDGEEQEITFTEKVYGGSLGGPIIEDKLFFMVGFEELKSEEPIEFGPPGGGYANEPFDVTDADIAQITQISQDTYGFNPGSYADLGSGLPEDDRKIFAKLDWNINDSHRAAFTYQYNKGNELNPQNNFGSTIGLPSNWYNKTETLKSYALQIFSDWTDNFSTEFKVSYKDVETRQESLMGNDFAEMEIETLDVDVFNNPATAGKVVDGKVVIGPDEFRHANALSNDTLSIKVAGTYSLDDHEISFGYENESLDVFNLFVNKSLGFYTFENIIDDNGTPDNIADDIIVSTGIENFNNRESQFFSYKNAVSNNSDDGAANFGYTVHSAYVQDTWTINEDLTIMAGLRYDWYKFGDSPNENSFFISRHNFSNTTTLDGKDLFQPRFAFNYNVDERTVVRGGVGLFGGGNPNVWVSNSWSNDGVTIAEYRDNDGVSGVDGFNIPAEGLAGVAAGDGAVNYVDPDFKIPSSWKINLAVEHEFDLGAMGDGYLVTAEAILSRVKNATTWVDTNIEVVGTAPDGRPIYDDAYPDNGNSYDLELTNTTEGKSEVFVLSLQKDFDNGLDIFASYTYTNAKDVNSGTSSTATSNYGKQAVSDINFPGLATSNYNRKHRIVISMDYRKEFIDGLESRFGLLLTSQSGRPFSYTFDGGFLQFGDSQWFRDRQQFYVPTDENDVNLNGITWAELDAFIVEAGLDKYRGQIAPRNAFYDPWYTKLDFKFSQEIPGIMDGHKGVFTFDIQNLTNLINNSWGRLEYTPFHYVQQIVDVDDISSAKYTYSGFNDNAGSKNISTLGSLWKIRLGIKYKF